MDLNYVNILSRLPAILVLWKNIFENQGTSSDVLQLANTNMPSNRCTKKTKAMQRRKCKSSKTSQEIMFYNEDEVQTTTK